MCPNAGAGLGCLARIQDARPAEDEAMRSRRYTDAISPILEQVLYGGSSVSMNVLTLTAMLPADAHLFQAQGLNHVILFKYPNFDASQGDEDDFLGGDFGSGDAPGERPVETGIYIPNNAQEWEAGGHAIYLRARNSGTLLEEYFGAEAVDRDAPHSDFALLQLIDDIPSLDAFLLKTCFEAKKIPVDNRYWQIDEDEEYQLRLLIRHRVEPIVHKALNHGCRAPVIERFLEAIWNPEMEEAGHFVSAFGIDRGEADMIFSAWKGITYYEYQLRRMAPRVRIILAWLKSRQCIPFDLKMHRPHDEQLLMHIERVGRLMDATLLDIRRVLTEYEQGFRALMAGHPGLFRDFLRNIRSRYWLLGYCVSALTSVVHVDSRCMKNNPARHVPFETLKRLLRQFEVALDRRREQRVDL